MKSSWLLNGFWVYKSKKEELENRFKVEDIVDFLEIEKWRKHPVGMLPYGVQ